MTEAAYPFKSPLKKDKLEKENKKEGQLKQEKEKKQEKEGEEEEEDGYGGYGYETWQKKFMRTSLSLYMYLISGGEVVKPKHNQRGREGVKELVFFGNKS